MRKIIDSYIIEVLLITRHFASWLFLLMFLFSIFSHLIGWVQMYNPGGALTSTAFIIQGGIFASMILGLSLIQKEEYCWSDEMFYALPKGFSSKIIAKCLVLISIIIMFICVSQIGVFVLFRYNDVPYILYGKSVLYLLLYWGIPFVIAGIIGMLAGLYIRSKLIYPLLILIWLLIGPLNIAVFKPLMGILRIDLNSMANFLNLGQTDPHLPYDPVYGLPLEIHRWLQKGLWLINIIVLFLISVLKKSNLKPPRLIIIVLIILLILNLPLLTSFTKEGQVITTRYEENSVRNYDRNYYSVNNHPVPQDDNSFIIESYEIDIESFRDLKAKVVMKIKLLKETEKVVFTLYHDLRVKSVTDEGNTELSYKQDGDQVLVSFPKTLNADAQREVIFIYEGTSSPYFYANEQAVMLPAYFPWVPIAGSYQAMQAENSYLIRNPLNPQTPTKYALRYSGPQPLFTNLPKKEENIWSGEAPCGITLAAGMLTETRIGSINADYPVSLNKMIGTVPVFLENIKPIFENIKDDFGLQSTYNPYKVFFLSIPPESSLTDLTLWNLGDHLIVGINQIYNNGDFLNNKTALVPIVASSLTRSINMAKQKEKTRVFFIASYAYWYSMDYDPAYNEQSKSILRSMIDTYKNLRLNLDNYEELGLENEENVIKQIKVFIDENKSNRKLLQFFFRDWLTNLNSNKIMNLEDITRLIKIKEGDNRDA